MNTKKYEFAKLIKMDLNSMYDGNINTLKALDDNLLSRFSPSDFISECGMDVSCIPSSPTVCNDDMHVRAIRSSGGRHVT